ncbi:MAG TPA: colanic acid biosynthesis glycosyltransferase WcaL [Anaerolineae bacterium]|nr:colanic acid biosynthesis glycosyltransferase WcaL [Anaerolineae bacterium]
MTKPTIAYVAQFFPILTETFVYREVNALRERGFDVVTLSNRTPEIAKLSEESIGLMDTTEYVFPIKHLAFLLAHLYFIFRHPIRYLGTLLHIMRQPDESMANRIRTLGHFGGGVYLAHRIHKKGVSHIHAHFAVNAATIGLVVSRLLNISYSFTVHNNIFTDQLILRTKLAAATFIISISEYSKQFLLDYAPEIAGLAQKIEIVHCGIPADSFRRSQPYRNGSAPRPPHLVSLSSFAERKGMPVLVEACRILRDRGLNFRCTIAGTGPDWQRVRQLVKEYNLRDRVNLPGRYFQEDIHAYLNDASAFALACVTAENGDIDGVPVALMESMAMEVPTISTTLSGIPELIDDGINGLLVPERDAEALADAIERLLQDHALSLRLGRDGRRKIVEAFNIDHTSQQLVDIFQRYLRRAEKVGSVSAEITPQQLTHSTNHPTTTTIH